MQMNGEYRIEAAQEDVWAALNDADMLRQALPGCEVMDRVSDTEFVAKVKLKVGPVSVSLAAKIALSDLDPPKGYTISGEGKGGPAGFAKGGAKVSLEAVDGATLLRYEVEAKLGGKLAQLGSRMIDATAKKMAGEFFGNLSELVAPAKVEEGDAVEGTQTLGSMIWPAQPTSFWSQPGLWVGGFVALVALTVIMPG